ncbi:SCO family protein [soil metagenome]|nr:SCO family protein [Trueperaceae bacterium]
MQPLVRRALVVSVALLAGALAYALGLALRPPPELAGTELDRPPRVVDLDLVAADGSDVRLADYAKRGTLLVFFGFTRCPDVCALTMAQLARVYDHLGAPDDLTVAMITVDPEYDTPEVLGPYVAAFHPDFVALSGTNSQIATAASTFFIGYAGIGSSNFVHTDVVAVVDRAGTLRFVYGQEALRRLPADLADIRRRPGF